MKWAAAPFSEIHRTGFAGSRRIFAEVSLPSVSKNSFLSDLPPGSTEGTRGKSAQRVVLAGEGFPRQEGLLHNPDNKTELSTTEEVEESSVLL